LQQIRVFRLWIKPRRIAPSDRRECASHEIYDPIGLSGSRPSGARSWCVRVGH